MSSDFDPSEFVDGDFESRKSPFSGAAAASAHAQRAPSREETDARIVEKQQKLAELKRAQEELEHERSALEETRRRQREFQTGREEMIQNLTRGLGLLEEAEFNARRDAEQMSKTVVEMREALNKVQAIHDEGWTKDNFSIELTRALTTLENARMEWNTARLKFPVLSGQVASEATAAAQPAHTQDSIFQTGSFLGLCRVGLALTWPVALVLLLTAGGVLAFLFLRR
jgi:hypothetical protein